MLAIVSRNVIKEGKKEEFLALVKELVEGSRKEAGCIEYNLYESTTNPNMLTFIEKWQDAAAIENHNQSAHFQKIVPLIQDFKEPGKSDLQTYKPLS